MTRLEAQWPGTKLQRQHRQDAISEIQRCGPAPGLTVQRTLGGDQTRGIGDMNPHPELISPTFQGEGIINFSSTGIIQGVAGQMRQIDSHRIAIARLLRRVRQTFGF